MPDWQLHAAGSTTLLAGGQTAIRTKQLRSMHSQLQLPSLGPLEQLGAQSQVAKVDFARSSFLKVRAHPRYAHHTTLFCGPCPKEPTPCTRTSTSCRCIGSQALADVRQRLAARGLRLAGQKGRADMGSEHAYSLQSALLQG